MTVKIGDPHVAFVLQDEIRRSEEARYDHRLHAVLLVAKGMSCRKVADYLGDPERTVRFWIRRYQEDGLQGLIENERSGRPPRISEKQMNRIALVLRKKPEDFGLSGGIWDGKSLSAYIRKDFGVALGIRQCQRLFRHLGFRLRKPRPMIARSDPEIQRMFKKNSAGC
jgi:transposase